MKNKAEISIELERDLKQAIDCSRLHKEIACLTTPLDISTVAAYADDHAAQVDYAIETDGTYDMWGWSDAMYARGKGDGEMLWRIKVTIGE